MTLAKILIPALLAATLAACGGDDDDTAVDPDASVDCSLVMAGQDEYTPGMEKIGDNGYTVRLLTSVPGPPVRGDNAWTVLVLDDTQTAAGGITIDVDPFMPQHGHPTPIEAVVTEVGDPGEYTLDPVNLFMPGVWEVTIELSEADTLVDDVMFAFCIDG
jgi:hypothetical protein